VNNREQHTPIFGYDLNRFVGGRGGKGGKERKKEKYSFPLLRRFILACRAGQAGRQDPRKKEKKKKKRERKGVPFSRAPDAGHGQSLGDVAAIQSKLVKLIEGKKKKKEKQEEERRKKGIQRSSYSSRPIFYSKIRPKGGEKRKGKDRPFIYRAFLLTFMLSEPFVGNPEGGGGLFFFFFFPPFPPLWLCRLGKREKREKEDPSIRPFRTPRLCSPSPEQKKKGRGGKGKERKEKREARPADGHSSRSIDRAFAERY